MQHVKINQLIDLVLFMSNSISINEQRTRMQNGNAASRARMQAQIVRGGERVEWSEREENMRRRDRERERETDQCVLPDTGTWVGALADGARA